MRYLALLSKRAGSIVQREPIREQHKSSHVTGYSSNNDVDARPVQSTPASWQSDAFPTLGHAVAPIKLISTTIASHIRKFRMMERPFCSRPEAQNRQQRAVVRNLGISCYPIGSPVHATQDFTADLIPDLDVRHCSRSGNGRFFPVKRPFSLYL